MTIVHPQKHEAKYQQTRKETLEQNSNYNALTDLLVMALNILSAGHYVIILKSLK